MSEEVGISSSAREIIQKFARLPAVIRHVVAQNVARELLVLEGKWRAATGVKLTGGRSGLVSRLTSFSRIVGTEFQAAIGFRKSKNFAYELSQEYGAHAKPGKAMVVPVSPRAKAMSERGLGPGSLPKGTLFRAGRVLWAKRMGGRNKANWTRSDMEWILIRGLKPRLKFMDTMRANMGDISNAIERGGNAALQQI